MTKNQSRAALVVGTTLLVVAILLPVAVGIAYYVFAGHGFVGAFFGLGTAVMVTVALRSCAR